MSTNPKKSAPAAPAVPASSIDVKAVEALATVMSQHDLSEIHYQDGSVRLRLRRGAMPSFVPTPMPMPTSHAAPAPAARPTTESAPAAAPAAPKKNLIEIKSETVGTFYSQPKPGEPSFVKVGDRVTPNKVIGLVEVMKTYNEVQANCTGTIVELLVENSTYVEFGQVLARVDPS